MAKASAHITLTYVIDIVATYRYYLLQSSTLAKPSVPTTNPPSSAWDDVEPSYTSGSTNSLYYVDLTVFSDDTFSYTPVSLSTAYEAAKEAYNKAANAQTTANNAQADIDNLEIGGRNLLPNSDVEVTKEVGVTQAEFIQYADLAPIFEEYGLIEYTLSFDIKSLDTTNSSVMAVYCQNGSATKHQIGYHYVNVTTEYERRSITFTPSIQNETETKSLLAFFGTYNTGNIPCVKNVKLEKGNRATDWTPAPEDVEERINDGDADVQVSVTEQLTQLVQDTEGIIMKKLESYVKDSDLGSIKESISAELQVKADQISAIITQINDDKTATGQRLEALENFFQKYFIIDENGLTIRSTDSSSTLQLDNDKGIVFSKDSAIQSKMWGDNFYTGNIFVEVTKQARFGGLAAVPRSERKLTWMEVGN